MNKDHDAIQLVFSSAGGEEVIDEAPIDLTATFRQRVPEGDTWETTSHEAIGRRRGIGSKGKPNRSLRLQ